MKRLIAMVLCLLFVISLAGCGKGNTKNLVIDYGTSSIYTKDDMDEAIDVIKKQFSSFEGCELHSLSYTSDDACNNEDNIAWMNDVGRILRTFKIKKNVEVTDNGKIII